MKQAGIGSFFSKSPDVDNALKDTNDNASASFVKHSSIKNDDNHPGVLKKRRTLPPSISIPTAMRTNSIKPTTNYPPKATSSASSEESPSGSYHSSFVGGFQRAGEKPFSKTTNRSREKESPSDASSECSLEKEYTLSQSQNRVLEAIMQRKSVFFTGAAGTGKSYILKVLMDVMNALDLSEKISFTAPTGVAACNIRGLTIHAWAGVGTAAEPLEQLIGQVMRNSQASRRWKKTEILVIDEISMLSAELFDKLDIIGRRLRNNMLPFGGLQLILCGDFFQLPPVGLGKHTHFCFESNGWKELFGTNAHPSINEINSNEMIILDKVFRQQDDLIFLNLLNELRKGIVTQQTNTLLLQKVQQAAAIAANQNQLPFAYPHNADNDNKDNTAAPVVRPTKLFSTNADVDHYNTQELQRLSEYDHSEPKLFLAIDDGRDPYLQQMRNGTKAPQSLLLKIGAQVMLLKNLSTESGLVNGSRGTVIDFERSDGRSTHYPWLPIVKFQVLIGTDRSEHIVTLKEETWDIRQGDSTLASRIQIPLILAWAISIHKSQGMTIPLLEISFNRMFEYGQAYVALSRATCLDGLTLRSFACQAVKAHPQVKSFYDWLWQQRRQQQQQQQQVQGEDKKITVTLECFVTQYMKEKVNTFDENQWMESRNNSNNNSNNKKNASSTATTITANNNNTFAAYEYDEWLENKVPRTSSSIITNTNNNNNTTSTFTPGNPFLSSTTTTTTTSRNKEDDLSNNNDNNNNNNNKMQRIPTIVKEYKPHNHSSLSSSSSVIDLLSDESNGSRPFANSATPYDHMTSTTNTLISNSYPPSPIATTPITTANATNSLYGQVHRMNDNPAAKSVTLTEDLKRKIEENRLKALEKLELSKRRRMEETSQIMNRYNI